MIRDIERADEQANAARSVRAYERGARLAGVGVEAAIDLALHHSKLEVAEALVLDSDVGLDDEVQVVVVPHLHLDQAPATAKKWGRFHQETLAGVPSSKIVRVHARADLVAADDPVHARGADLVAADDPGRQRRLAWAVLMKRAYAIDVLICPRCQGPMRLLSVIQDERVARRILEHLSLPARAPA